MYDLFKYFIFRYLLFLYKEMLAFNEVIDTVHDVNTEYLCYVQALNYYLDVLVFTPLVSLHSYVSFSMQKCVDSRGNQFCL